MLDKKNVQHDLYFKQFYLKTELLSKLLNVEKQVKFIGLLIFLNLAIAESIYLLLPSYLGNGGYRLQIPQQV